VSVPKPRPAEYGTVYVVRHGRTALNAAGVLRGRLDPPLDDVGEEQARALGALFANSYVDAIFCSPLQRARQTAEPIAASTGSTLACEDAFVDRDYGPWAGKARAEIDARYGSLDRAPEIEPMGSLVSRVVLAAREVAARFDAVVIVGHDVVNRALLARLASNTVDEPDAIPQRTGCWNKLEHVDLQWVATVVDALPGDGQLP
jgi:broad specificity phosphatase PhoE